MGHFHNGSLKLLVLVPPCHGAPGQLQGCPPWEESVPQSCGGGRAVGGGWALGLWGRQNSDRQPQVRDRGPPTFPGGFAGSRHWATQGSLSHWPLHSLAIESFFSQGLRDRNNQKVRRRVRHAGRACRRRGPERRDQIACRYKAPTDF